MSVRLSDSTHTRGTTRPSLTRFSVHVARGRGSVLLSRHCDTPCTSGFVDDFMFFYNGSLGDVTLPPQPRCNPVHGLTPFMRGISYQCPVLDDGSRQH